MVEICGGFAAKENGAGLPIDMPPARWQLRQMFLKQGFHLAKREKAPLYSGYCKSPFERSFSHWDEATRRFEPSSDKPMAGNLPNDQYRYFQGCRPAIATYSKCRTCLVGFTSRSDQLQHFKKSGCNKIFNDALKIWLGNQRRISIILEPCAVCSAKTLHRKWGIPLCLDTMCIEKWMFDIVTPPDLRIILIGMTHA